MRVPVVVLCLAVTGCGAVDRADRPATATERAVGEGYLELARAFADGRYEAFCEGLSAESRKVTSRNIFGVEMSCEDWAEENARIFGDEFDRVARSATIESVEVVGDKATIDWTSEYSGGRSGGRVTAKRVDGRWLYTAVTPLS